MITMVTECVTDDGVLVEVHLPESLHETASQGSHVAAGVAEEVAGGRSGVPHANTSDGKHCFIQHLVLNTSNGKT